MLEKSRKPRGRPFVKGDPRAGRPKGSTNLVSREIREIARGLLEDEVYQAGLVRRLRAGKAPQIEALPFFYAFGKPTERYEVTSAVGDFSRLSDDELMAQFEATFVSLRAGRRVNGEKESLSPSAPTTG